MKTQHILDELGQAPYGAYAVDASQSILFWNAAAEATLGHTAADIVGRKCYDAVASVASQGLNVVCKGGCPSVRAARRGRIPQPANVQMLCADGRRKLVAVTATIIPADELDGAIIVHLFREIDVSTELGKMISAATASGERATPLSVREIEILGMLAEGLESNQIAERLFVSYATVRAHIANAREKLNARNIATALLAAERQGLI